MGALTMGRSMAASRFTESLQFFSADGVTVDPDTLNEVEAITVLYTVPGRVKYPTLTVSERSSVGQVFAAQSVVVHVAVGSAPNVVTNHFVRVVASTSDSLLVGRKFRVSGSPQSGQVTSHRFPVEEVS